MKVDSVLHHPKCKTCAKPSAHIEVVAPHGYPQESEQWTKDLIQTYKKYRDFTSYYLMYSGPGGSNGMIGDAISIERVALLKQAFSEPYNPKEIKAQFFDMAGYCVPCQDFYCADHWNVTATGDGTCPEGHDKTLDPHWSPEPKV